MNTDFSRSYSSVKSLYILPSYVYILYIVSIILYLGYIFQKFLYSNCPETSTRRKHSSQRQTLITNVIITIKYGNGSQ